MWAVKDEWIDLAQGQHVVVFHNPDVLVPAGEAQRTAPVEHHLIHRFNVDACPTCGTVRAAEPVDFVKRKHETLAALNAHHKTLVAYREKHPHVRIGSGPKR